MDEKDKAKAPDRAADDLWGSLWYDVEAPGESFDDEETPRDGEPRDGEADAAELPLLSLREKPVAAVCEQVLMLAGARKVFADDSALLIRIGEKETADFSVKIESRLVFADEPLSGEAEPDGDNAPENPDSPGIWQNRYKNRITEEECDALRAFLAERKKVAFQNGVENK